MPLHLDILDVGQGDGMVVWLPTGKVMMVDLGSTKRKGLVTQDSFKYFRENTAFKNDGQEIEWLVLTHGDQDHYNMITKFLDTFKPSIKNVLHGGLEEDYRGLIGRLRGRQNPNGKATTIQTGAHRSFYPLASYFDLGAEVMVMASGVEAAGGDHAYAKNTRSTVLRIVYQNIGLLLTGDATRDTEGQMLGRMMKEGKLDSLRAQVLKVGHHGSHRTSNHAAFIAAVRPNYAFISSDRSGSLDPDPEQKATGHRLPQALTISLLQKYSKFLQQDCAAHSYVMSYQQSDYEEYNANPDIRGQTLDLPQSDEKLAWIQVNTTQGIFSTLAIMGLSDDPSDEGAKDIGVQYRVSISDQGDFEILSTFDFKEWYKLAGQAKNPVTQPTGGTQ